MPEFKRVRIKACYCSGEDLGLLGLGSWGYVIFALSCVLGGLLFWGVLFYLVCLFRVWIGAFDLCMMWLRVGFFLEFW